MLCKGLYDYFSTKQASASRGLCPLTPTKGLCRLDPQGCFAPPNNLPWRRLCSLDHVDR